MGQQVAYPSIAPKPNQQQSGSVLFWQKIQKSFVEVARGLYHKTYYNHNLRIP